MSFYKHPTAEVSGEASIGDGTKIWNNAHVRENSTIGENCILGDGVYVDKGVRIGNNVKIQNYALIYRGVTVEDGVFIGPHVCFTNDKNPRAINEDGRLQSDGEWEVDPTLVKRGASIGANSTILPGVTIGEFAMVGAGSVVTEDVPPFSLVTGNPARAKGKVDARGNRVEGL